MTPITKALRRGQISGYLRTHSVNETAEEFNCSRNTACMIRVNELRRTDMDALRRKRLSKKKKGKSALAFINERRRTVDRLLQQTIVHVEDKNGNTRIIPKHPTTHCVRNFFRDHPLRRVPKNNAGVRHRNSPGDIPSISTLRRDAIALDYRNFVRPRVPYVLAQKKRRLKFCKNENFQKESYVKRLLFSDEHVVTTNDYSSRTQWVKVGKCRRLAKSKVLPAQRKSKYNTVSRMFWAMIGWNYKSPIIWCEFKLPKKTKKDDDGGNSDDEDDGKKKKKKKKEPDTTTTMNGERYVKYILTKVKPKLQQKKMIFMQD